ncbi:MAG: 50S ribosomal protein L20 [Patescibacteria group bacterium]
MTRVKRGVAAHKRHKRLLKETKGYRGLRSRTFKQAKTAWMKAGEHAFVDRRRKKRTFRQLWIVRLSAACKLQGLNYSRFIEGLTRKAILIDRKMLADLAVNEPEAFTKLVEAAKEGMEKGMGLAKKA